MAQADELSKIDLIGKIDPSKHLSFVKVSAPYGDRSDLYLRKEAAEAFQKMHTAALKDGIKLKIISATRNFNYQKGIWEGKWKKSKYKNWKDLDKIKNILEYSSMPTSSRHHWGTDVDLNSLEPSYFNSGEGKKIFDWLTKNAKSFGFDQPYTDKSLGRTGYNEEKWHWSYSPLSIKYLKSYNEQIKYSDISGFKGSDLAKDIQIIELYVNGVSPSLK